MIPSSCWHLSSGVWSCFNVLQRNLHSSWGVNSTFCGALHGHGHGKMPGVISAFVIHTQFKRSSETKSQCSWVWREIWHTVACSIEAACVFVFCADPCRVSTSLMVNCKCGDKNVLLLLLCFVYFATLWSFLYLFRLKTKYAICYSHPERQPFFWSGAFKSCYKSESKQE